MNRRLRALLAAAVLLVSTVLHFALPDSASAATVGFRGLSYVGATAPTGQKPQSKLWFNDGIWWGSLFNTTSKHFEIFRYSRSAHTWATTGTLIDERASSYMDTLWDGTHLYVATAGPSDVSSQRARLMRFAYSSSSKTYAVSSGYPVNLTTGGVKAIVVDKDSSGLLWATYTKSNRVWFLHSTTSDGTWTAPAVLPFASAANIGTDEISAVVAYDGDKLGLMWSNQNEMVMYFATHRDGDADDVWTAVAAYREPEGADDHMNLKSLQADPSGRVFAAVKTSLNHPTDPLINLLVLRADGTWTSAVFGTVADNHTRAIVQVDADDRRVYMFAASPCCSGGSIYMKSAPLDDIRFPPGRGTPFIQSDTDPKINNPTSSKQVVGRASGLVVMAGDDSTRRYLFNDLDLSGSSTTTTQPTTTTTQATTTTTAPSGTLFSDGFETGDFRKWTRVVTGAGVAEVEPGIGRSGYGARFAADGTSGSAGYARTTIPSPPPGLSAETFVRVTSEGAAENTPVFRLLDSSGARVVSVLRRSVSGRVYIDYAGTNFQTDAFLPAGGGFSDLVARAVPGGAGAGVLEVWLNGTLIYRNTTATLPGRAATIQVGSDWSPRTYTAVFDDVSAWSS
ncbi:MAG: hypothetical protein ABR549_19335 [Mycobacteriales bacterium]